MNIEEVKKLIKEIEPDEFGSGYIDCSTATDYSDDKQYERIVAALKQNVELQQKAHDIEIKNIELMNEKEAIERRINHLLESKTLAAYDLADPKTKEYLLDINEIDSFVRTGNRLIFEYAAKNKVDRVDDFIVKTKKDKKNINYCLVYEPAPKSPIKVTLEIIENDVNDVCPICKNELGKYPAISRKDNKTKICSNCGMEEALSIFAKHLETKKESE